MSFAASEYVISILTAEDIVSTSSLNDIVDVCSNDVVVAVVASNLERSNCQGFLATELHGRHK